MHSSLGNSASLGGAVVFHDASSPSAAFVDCIFEGNSALYGSPQATEIVALEFEVVPPNTSPSGLVFESAVRVSLVDYYGSIVRSDNITCTSDVLSVLLLMEFISSDSSKWDRIDCPFNCCCSTRNRRILAAWRSRYNFC